MKHLHLRKLIEYFFASFFIIAVFYLGNKIGFMEMIEFIKSHLLLSLFLYFLYCIISNVLIFLPFVPLWPIMLYLYGFSLPVIITIVGTIIAASISFFLARSFGKKFVMRIMGKHLFNEVKHLSEFKNTQNFFLVRFIGNNYYDIISYMAGLSSITFKTYILVTTIVTSIWTIALFYLIKLSGGIENINSVLTLLTIYAVIVFVCTCLWEIHSMKHAKNR